jgi:hypothetical protein
MRENLTSGLMGGSWKRGSPSGHLRVPGRCAEKRHPHGLGGTQPVGHLPPRQLPTRLRHGVSSATFGYLRHFTWRRVVCWLRHKHRRANWKQLRRRYLTGVGWWPEQDGVALFDPAAVAVTRYRYRGTSIPTPWTRVAIVRAG